MKEDIVACVCGAVEIVAIAILSFLFYLIGS